jgi:hypothetical protein
VYVIDYITHIGAIKQPDRRQNMSYYTVVAEYPAYKVLAGSEKRYYAPNETFRINLNLYQLSDVMSYALSKGECPFAAYQQASDRGHEIYFAFTLSACISSSPKKQEVTFAQEFGDVITYAGKKFQIMKAPNNNVRLVEVK